MHPTDLSPIASSVLFLLGLAILIASGRGTVTKLEALSQRFRFARFHLAFLVMAFATSLPELFVGITSAFAHVPQLSAGNVLGSNIADITLVLGIVILAAGKLQWKTALLRDAVFQFSALALLPFLLLRDGMLSRLEGLFLLVLFGFAVRHVVRHHHLNVPAPRPQSTPYPPRALLLFSLSVAGLLLGAHFVVSSSIALAALFGISPFILGLFAVAIGTSLPELTFELTAVRQRKGDFALGDATGSVICNATLVLGLTAVLRPITVTPSVLVFPAVITVLALLLLLLLLQHHKHYSRTIGIGMLLLYALFLLGEARDWLG